MELKALRFDPGKVIRKYKFVIIILLVGIVLMVWPSQKTEKAESMDVIETAGDNSFSLEQKLEDMLSCVKGAGQVKVLLTVSEGERTVYQTDLDESASGNGSDKQSKTVTITDSKRNESGMVQQVIPPMYQGAIILCQGANDPSVKLSIVDAVSKLTGLGADCISVLKMK